MSFLPHHLYRAEQVRDLDKLAIGEFGITGATLMARAGVSAFSALSNRWPRARRVAVVCGVGNNGGDGYDIARLAHEMGLGVKLLQLGPLDQLHGDALDASRLASDVGVISQPFEVAALKGMDVVVDAIFGTGLCRPVEGEWRAAIEAINDSGLPVLAVDIPSGMSADTGHIMGAAVRAQLTVTFIALKQGMFTAHGSDCCGAILFDDLQVSAKVYDGLTPSAVRLSEEKLSTILAPRQRSAHKGLYGHALVIGGEMGMCGAARLASEAAARVGAGLVSVATRPANAPIISAARPELMCHGVSNPAELAGLLSKANVVAVGPGLGCSKWACDLFDAAIAAQCPLVVDADALNLLAQTPVSQDGWVLTPHPGEAARLLGCTAADIQADRFTAVREIQRRYGGVVVLKGNGSLIYAGEEPVGLCDAGNAGLAAGGFGDVLTGVIAGLMAQGVSTADAARLGVLLHAKAGDRAAINGERGMMASDLMEPLRRLVNPPAATLDHDSAR